MLMEFKGLHKQAAFCLLFSESKLAKVLDVGSPEDHAVFQWVN